MEAWNIKQLKEALDKDLLLCTCQLERDCCKAIAGMEIREKAKEWSKTRKLSPCEVAIAREFGFKL